MGETNLKKTIFLLYKPLFDNKKIPQMIVFVTLYILFFISEFFSFLIMTSRVPIKLGEYTVPLSERWKNRIQHMIANSQDFRNGLEFVFFQVPTFSESEKLEEFLKNNSDPFSHPPFTLGNPVLHFGVLESLSLFEKNVFEEESILVLPSDETPLNSFDLLNSFANYYEIIINNNIVTIDFNNRIQIPIWITYNWKCVVDKEKIYGNILQKLKNIEEKEQLSSLYESESSVV